MLMSFPGITFIRVSRPATRIMYTNDETFAIGKAKVVRKSDSDAVLVIAAGITMDQAVDAAAKLGNKWKKYGFFSIQLKIAIMLGTGLIEIISVLLALK